MADREYWQLLKDPRWLAKRDEVVKAARWCEECHVIEGCTFHVHHTYYEYGRKPWDYPNESLRCLCENCHNARHEAEKKLRQLTLSLNTSDIQAIIDMVQKRKQKLEDHVLSQRYSEHSEDWFEEGW